MLFMVGRSGITYNSQRSGGQGWGDKMGQGEKRMKNDEGRGLKESLEKS
jgi:hypothetical protein